MILSVPNENKAEILNDHYKDTCLRLERYRKQRNRLVFYAAITLLIAYLLQIYPTQTLYIAASIFLRIGIDKVPEIVNAPVPMVRLFPSIVLLIISFTFKHYRIAVDKQFAYVQMLESDLNSLYPRSNLFKRETNFSSKESNSFSMWDSANYSKLLVAGCCLLVLPDIGAIIYVYSNENYLVNVIAALMSIPATLLSLIFFATQKPITGTDIINFLDKIVTIRPRTATQKERDDNAEPESRIWNYIVGAIIVVFWVIMLIEYFCSAF